MVKAGSTHVVVRLRQIGNGGNEPRLGNAVVDDLESLDCLIDVDSPHDFEIDNDCLSGL